MATKDPNITINWFEVDKMISGLELDEKHEIYVQREAIPLVFVPGLMGSRLRKFGSDPNKEENGLPNLRWDPGSKLWLCKLYKKADRQKRKSLLLGMEFNADYLEVDNADPVGDGFQGIGSDYRNFLDKVKTHDWGVLRRIFEFPVYAVGYNWTDDNEKSGEKLADTIKEIITEAQKVTGFCQKVILITHSMGGLVARAASRLSGAENMILGIIHGVQPANGAPAAYWRIKGGFEGGWSDWTSDTLGRSGPYVTPWFANFPSTLQLLPNKLYRNQAGDKCWLIIKKDNIKQSARPEKDPYEEIYRVPAKVHPKEGEKPSTNQYWGLVDDDLLYPDRPYPDFANHPDRISYENPTTKTWPKYLFWLDKAKQFHERLGNYQHPQTYCITGNGLPTAETVEFKIGKFRKNPSPGPEVKDLAYKTRGFRGFFRDKDGNMMQAVLQRPSGDGDGTVPCSSAGALDKGAQGSAKFNVDHQNAYNGTWGITTRYQYEKVREYTFKAIIALCQVLYKERREKVKTSQPAEPAPI